MDDVDVGIRQLLKSTESGGEGRGCRYMLVGAETSTDSENGLEGKEGKEAREQGSNVRWKRPNAKTLQCGEQPWHAHPEATHGKETGVGKRRATEAWRGKH
jgi:hypothetical protein